MYKLAALRFRQPAILSLILGLAAYSLPVPADEPGRTTADPGFRPESEYAAAFLDNAVSTKTAVIPTLVRSAERTAHSFASQAQIIEFLNDSGITTAVTKPQRIDLGPMRRPSQWEIFQSGTDSIAAKLPDYDTGAEYTLAMELLVPEDQAVFGIEVYIMDRQGNSAFSFLLNSHHELFAEAKLRAKNRSEESRNEMIANATRIGLEALKLQIEQAKSNASPDQETGVLF